MTAPQEKPRLYYDCPLKAAWMAKYFGVKIDLGTGVYGLAAKATVENGRLVVTPGFSAEHFRYYIHPDSLHLLEPQVGDMVTNIGMTGWKVTRIEGRAIAL